MENPIGRKKREELKEIKLEAQAINEKLNKFDLFIIDFEKIKEQINILFEFMTSEDEQPSQEEIDKQMAEQMQMFEGIMENAFIKIVNKPDNQKAIMEFAGQFSQGMQGKGQLSDMMLPDGSVNWIAAIEKFMQGRSGQTQLQGQPAAQKKGKSTGY